MTRGIDRRVLDGVNTRSLAGFGWESFAWVRCTGFTDGGLPMGSIPGKHTGDGRFDGETSLGGLLIFFLGGWGRGRGDPGCVLLRGFSQDERDPNSPVCVIYYMLSSGSGLDRPSTCSHSDDIGGAASFVPPRTPRSSGYDFFMHMRSMLLYVICLLYVIFLLYV